MVIFEVKCEVYVLDRGLKKAPQEALKTILIQDMAIQMKEENLIIIIIIILRSATFM